MPRVCPCPDASPPSLPLPPCVQVRPKLVSSVHYSEVTKNYTTQEYRDVTANRCAAGLHALQSSSGGENAAQRGAGRRNRATPVGSKVLGGTFWPTPAADLACLVLSCRGAPTSSVYPQYDASGNPLTTEFGLCKYIDNQVGRESWHCHCWPPRTGALPYIYVPVDLSCTTARRAQPL